MLNFSRWLLNEGFELPFRVIKDIYEFYKKVINEDDNGSNKRRREKVFKIDFTGTNFEFLNKLNADLKVLVGYEHNYHLTRYSTSFQHNGIYIGLVNTNPICGTIILPMLDLKSSGQKEIYEHVITIAIEHEVLHFVQDWVHRQYQVLEVAVEVELAFHLFLLEVEVEVEVVPIELTDQMVQILLLEIQVLLVEHYL